MVAHNAVNQAMIGAALGLPPQYFRRLLQVRGVFLFGGGGTRVVPGQPGKSTASSQQGVWWRLAAVAAVGLHLAAVAPMRVVAHNAVNQEVMGAALGLLPQYCRRLLQVRPSPGVVGGVLFPIVCPGGVGWGGWGGGFAPWKGGGGDNELW